MTTYILKNVQVTAIKAETDSDTHFILSQNGTTMIAEVPYPGCVNNSSPFYCFITHARHASDSGSTTTATVIGVGFFDVLHGQSGAPANGIELHPVLAMCFGQDCTPQ
jgi:hypothetical protein